MFEFRKDFMKFVADNVFQIETNFYFTYLKFFNYRTTQFISVDIIIIYNIHNIGPTY